jgi:hypothetical protein
MLPFGAPPVPMGPSATPPFDHGAGAFSFGRLRGALRAEGH